MSADYSDVPQIPVRAPDLVGCGYRFVQRQRHPGTPPTRASEARGKRTLDAVATVLAALPVRRGLGDGRAKPFLRLDLDPASADAEFDTLEALASGAHLITGAVFTGADSGQAWRADADILVKGDDGRYMPVIVSNHRVARRSETATMWAVATNRLGLSDPLELSYRQRHHVTDGYRLGLAARALAEVGLDSGRGGAIGQDRDKAFLVDTDSYQPALDAALQADWPSGPRRLKECDSCRFWSFCEPELIAADDISLLLPGDRARTVREQGIATVTGLIDADVGTPSALAKAWRDGVVLLRTTDAVTGPHADVEIDVDMEAYLDQGAYLWGAFDGEEYQGFATWETIDSDAEAENFARFWAWLMQRRQQAHSEGKSFAAYCYSAHGENHWLHLSARRFGGRRFGQFVVPTDDEVSEFIASKEWVDLFVWVRSQLTGPDGIGLKIVAPEAGYTWSDEDFDGEESINARRTAVGDDAEGHAARRALLRYNEDDTRATAAVRSWLRAGAPGAAHITEL